MTKIEFINKLSNIINKLKAPKSQYNAFGKYSYRNCEDILEAVKPLLTEAGFAIFISDDIVLIGDRYYICSTGIVTDGEHEVKNRAYAREPLNRKGMDEAQVTGASSSYARKYMLNGLFSIDDTKDPDSMDNSQNKPKPNKPQTPRKNYKQIAEIVGKIKDQMAVLCNGMSPAEKGDAITEFLQVNRFDDLNNKDEKFLSERLERVQLEIMRNKK